MTYTIWSWSVFESGSSSLFFLPRDFVFSKYIVLNRAINVYVSMLYEPVDSRNIFSRPIECNDFFLTIMNLYFKI